MTPRLVPAPISLLFSESSLNSEAFLREYQQLSESDENPINQWLKLAKARGEMVDTDPVLLNLLVEMHNKIDALENFLRDEEPSRVSLTVEANIESIGFEYFSLKDALLSPDIEYYARVEMPVHPKRDIAIFFTAVDEKLAKIEKIHERDEKEWGAYMTARERVLIREMRESR